MLDRVLLGGGDHAVLERDVFCELETHSFAHTVEAHTVEEDVMHRKAFQTGHVYCFLGIGADDIAEREIAPFGVELTLVIAIRCAATAG